MKKNYLKHYPFKNKYLTACRRSFNSVLNCKFYLHSKKQMQFIKI